MPPIIKRINYQLAIVLLLMGPGCFAQSNAVRQVQSKMSKGSWSSARQQIDKSLLKDTSNAEMKWLKAQWFFAKVNSNRQIDSAYQYINRSIASFKNLPEKQKDRLKKENVDDNVLLGLRIKIDSAAFDRAKQLNTESSYDYFIFNFPLAIERHAAIELRDEVSFLDALKINTYQSFDDYVTRHPQSQRVAESKQRYETLLFESKTQNHKFKSYVAFVKEFPSSPYRLQADRQIFEIATARGDTSAFIDFIHNFPENRIRSTAFDRLFYLYKELEENVPEEFLTDSLREVVKLNDRYWIPFLENGKFGFIDEEGNEAIAPRFESIDRNYHCGKIQDDLLITSDGLISRDGRIIAGHNPVLHSIGHGLIKVGDSTCVKLMHKSGKWVLNFCAEDFLVVGNRFLGVKRNGQWMVYSLTGKQLFSNACELMEMIEEVLVLTRLGKKILFSLDQVELAANGNIVQEGFVFDEVRSAGKGKLLVRNGSMEGILNSKLEFIVPLDRQTLTLTPYGLIRNVNEKISISGVTPELEDQLWDKIAYYKQWLLFRKGSIQKLFDLNVKKTLVETDSCWFAGGLAFAKKNDSIRVYINSLRSFVLPKESKINFIKARDSVRNFFVETRQKKTVFDIASGQRLFTAEFDKIELLNENVFIISRKEKKGLLSTEGKQLLPIEYETIVQLKDNYWSLYKDKKFGLLDLGSNKLVKPVYSRNVGILNKDILIVFRDGFYGLMGWDGKALTKFEFDEIQPWQGTQIWVKKNFSWTLYDLHSAAIVVDKIKDFYFIKNTREEKIVIVHRENFYGVVNTGKGVIIPPTFSRIINLGTEDRPLYFTDKEVEEAGIHVVIYYDQLGKFLRKQVYEEEDFERILCEE